MTSQNVTNNPVELNGEQNNLGDLENLAENDDPINNNIVIEITEDEPSTVGNTDFISMSNVTGDENTGFLNQDSIAFDAGNDVIKNVLLVSGNGDRNRAIYNLGEIGEGQEVVITTGSGNDSIRGINIVTGNGEQNTGIRNYETTISTDTGIDRVFGLVRVEGSGAGNTGISNVFSFRP